MPKDTHIHFYQPDSLAAPKNKKNPLNMPTEFIGSSLTTNILSISSYVTDVTLGPVFVAYSDISPTILTSSNGVTWTAPNNIPISSIASVSWNSNQILAVGSVTTTGLGPVLTSKDLNTWEYTNSQYSVTGGSITSVANGMPLYGTSMLWVATTSNGIITSLDGTTWKTPNNNPFSYAYSVGYGNSNFVAIGIDSISTTKIAVSPDGYTWALANNLPFSTSTIQTVAYVNNQWMAGGRSGTTTIGISSNGYNWVNSSNDIFSGGTCLGFGYGNNTVGSTLYVAVGKNSNATSTIALSKDGFTWTSPTNDPFSGGQCSAVTYGSVNGSSIWISVGSNSFGSTIATSTDASTWNRGSNIFLKGRKTGITFISSYTIPVVSNTTLNFDSNYSFGVLNNKIALTVGTKQLIFRDSVIDYLNRY